MNKPSGLSSQSTTDDSTLSQLPVKDFLPLSVNYPKIAAFESFVGWGLITIAFFLVDLLVEKIPIHVVAVPILFGVSVLSGVFGYYSAKVCGYHNRNFELLYKQGIWWRKQTALSYSRVQHIDISNGPLERKYGMATIKFFTAGGSASDLRIPGLANDIAAALRNEILQHASVETDIEIDQK